MEHRNEKLQATRDANNDAAAGAAGLEADVNSMKELLRDFPTETQLLKLERRVESLKNQVRDARDAVNQNRTGIEAYAVRTAACSSTHEVLARDLQDSTSVLLEQRVNAGCDADGQVKSDQHIMDSLSALCELCEEREAALADLNERLAQKSEEASELNRRIANLEACAARDLPQIEADADRIVNELNRAWTAERDALQNVYDSFHAVNREQQYHLQRGTHVKREAFVDGKHESALSARHARLASQLIETRNRLNEIIAENAYAKKTAEQLRAEGREALLTFDAQRNEVEGRLTKVKEERQAVEAEASRFREIKSDLHRALQTIREAPGQK